MQRKLFVLFAGLVLFSLMIAPIGTANAQARTQASAPNCPPFDQTLMHDKGFLKSLPPECAKAYHKLMQNDKPGIAPTPLSVGGPDAFGYTYNDTVSYNWVAASTDTGISGDDEISGAVNIGFNFPFYGINYSQLYFNTNGGITFGSGSYEYGSFDIPNTNAPNNLIAPLWEDLVVGSPDNSGAIFYSQGGVVPNRYFILEWRAVTTYEGTSAFSFEAILYENGDIVFQHQSLPASYYSTVGIENSVGDEGLQYQLGSSGLSVLKAIHFYYPTAITARVLISPLESSSFAAPGGTTDFVLAVANTGSMGVDTYDLTAASVWPVTFYAADGVTPLTDTDSDGTLDTGSVAQGNTVTITARVITPGGATVGNANTAAITARSSLNTGKSKTASLQSAIPAPFAQIYSDSADGAMSLDLIRPNAQVVKKVTADGHDGYNLAVTAVPNGNFIYLWTKYRGLGSVYVYEIEYTLLDHYGNTVRAVSKLADHSGATMTTRDSSPSVAVAPNGSIGVAWFRYLYNSATSQFNYNIYFATLDGSGNLITGPTNVTNNTVWGTDTDLNIPGLYYPTITASDDNRFIISWEDFREIGVSSWQSNIWYATRDTAGASVFPPTALTSDNISYVPVINSLTGGKAILTLKRDLKPYYAVINSDGSISSPVSSLGATGTINGYPIDAVLLPSGKVAAAWATTTGIQFSILNSAYTLESGPFSAANPNSEFWGGGLSVTTDIDSHVIMTWTADYAQNLFYALGDSTGAFITPPMSYKTSTAYIDISGNGQGNAPYTKFGDVPLTYWANSYIERLYNAGITGGCSTNPLMYCPDATVTRAQMAIFLLKGMHGSIYTPPAVGADSGFTDVPSDYWAAAWIKQLAAEGITGGCGAGIYCPDATVTRAQMAVFLLKAEHGVSYSPPSATGVFTDVPVGYWADKWIEQLASEGITGGCGGGIYCPDSSVTRAQMAVFLVKTFNLP